VRSGSERAGRQEQHEDDDREEPLGHRAPTP
jgi:hypothetical protein